MLQDLMLEWDVEVEEDVSTRASGHDDASLRPSLAKAAAAGTWSTRNQDATSEAETEKRCCEVHPDGPGVGGD